MSFTRVFMCHFNSIYHIMSPIVAICDYFSLWLLYPCHIILSSLRGLIELGTKLSIQQGIYIYQNGVKMALTNHQSGTYSCLFKLWEWLYSYYCPLPVWKSFTLWHRTWIYRTVVKWKLMIINQNWVNYPVLGLKWAMENGFIDQEAGKQC